MEKQAAGAGGLDVTALLGELARDSEKLIRLQFDLLRSDLGRELRKAGGAALALGAGAGLLAAGGLLSTQMLVHLLRRVTGLPLWACYGLLAGGLGAAGATLVARGRARAAELGAPALSETVAGLKENVAWLKEQVRTAGA